MGKSKRLLALFLCLILAFSLSISACEKKTDDKQATDQTQSELFGSPWVTSVVQGNLPNERPDIKDDLFTYFNYDYLKEHQESPEIYMNTATGDIQKAVISAINDESRTDNEISQLRIFYNQLSDSETLKNLGFSEIQPYIDKINSVTTIAEFNDLISSTDFPFSPFVNATLGMIDTRGVYGVVINPNFVLCDAILFGSKFYKEGKDEATQQQNDTMLQKFASNKLADASLIGLETKEQLQEAAIKLIDFEKSYGKYAENPGGYTSEEYGSLNEAIKDSVYSLADLCALCPNIPLEKILTNLSKNTATNYSAVSSKWLSELNTLWTEENLDTLKLVAKVSILNESRPYRDASALNELILQNGGTVDEAANVYNACDDLNTFSQLISKIYVNDVLGDTCKNRLKDMTKDLIDSYKELINETSWISDETKTNLLTKLENITINILEPTSGFLDYSGLQLIPSDQGGTAFTNYLKLKQYRYNAESAFIGQKTNSDSVWYMIKGSTVNAFYDPMSNSINVLPGIVNSALYNENMTEYELLGSLGITIGHELSHAFDYMGSQLDAYGQANFVFAGDDLDKFLAKTQLINDYYSSIEVLKDVKVDGQNVLAEAASDLCSLQVCLKLLDKDKNADYEQFTAAFAKTWAAVYDENNTQQQLMDSHPFNNQRVNVNVQMFDKYYEMYGISEGDGMYLAPADRIIIWGADS